MRADPWSRTTRNFVLAGLLALAFAMMGAVQGFSDQSVAAVHDHGASQEHSLPEQPGPSL